MRCNLKQLNNGMWYCPACDPRRKRLLPKKASRRCRAHKGTDPPHPILPQQLLGDRVGEALKLIGVTEEKVSRWLGRPCGCRERREKLNRLDRWARRVVAGKTARAREFLEKVLSQ